MTYIRTIPPEEAEGPLAEIYEQDIVAMGYPPNYTRAMSLRPDMMLAWRNLNNTLKSQMDLRLYELATLATAMTLKSSYCSLAHGSVLRSNFYSDEQVADIALDFRNASLAPAEVALMAYAEKIARNANDVTRADIDRLRSHGFSDEDILNIAFAASARCFLSKILDALGAEPDSAYLELNGALREVLTVGRAISGESKE